MYSYSRSIDKQLIAKTKCHEYRKNPLIAERLYLESITKLQHTLSNLTPKPVFSISNFYCQTNLFLAVMK